MKKILLNINHGYLFFGTSIYVGLLWALHFIWYPSWANITLDTVTAHFLGPVNSATQFFTFIVPPMIFCNLVMIVVERKSAGSIRLPLMAFASLMLMLVVGGFFIRPINEKIADGIQTANELNELLTQWMFLNDVRLILMTAMWLIIMAFFMKAKR